MNLKELAERIVDKCIDLQAENQALKEALDTYSEMIPLKDRGNK